MEIIIIIVVVLLFAHYFPCVCTGIILGAIVFPISVSYGIGAWGSVVAFFVGYALQAFYLKDKAKADAKLKAETMVQAMKEAGISHTDPQPVNPLTKKSKKIKSKTHPYADMFLMWVATSFVLSGGIVGYVEGWVWGIAIAVGTIPLNGYIGQFIGIIPKES